MIIEEKGYNCDRLSRGDKLVIGNGTYGYRGTIEENTANECVALNASVFTIRKMTGGENRSICPILFTPFSV